MGKQRLKSTVDLTGRVIGKIMISLVRFYQLTISPLLGSNCRHVPTCSTYMIDAIREWGAAKGFWLGVKRISKCHPWGTSGFDPVPKKSKKNPFTAKPSDDSVR